MAIHYEEALYQVYAPLHLPLPTLSREWNGNPAGNDSCSHLEVEKSKVSHQTRLTMPP